MLINYIDRKIKDFRGRQIDGCNSECKFGRKCLDFVDFEIVTKYTHQFWGTENEMPKLPAERKNSMKSLYETLKGGFDVSMKTIFTLNSHKCSLLIHCN